MSSPEADHCVVNGRKHTSLVYIPEELSPFEQFEHMKWTTDQTCTDVMVAQMLHYVLNGFHSGLIHECHARHVYYKRLRPVLRLLLVVLIDSQLSQLKDL